MKPRNQKSGVPIGYKEDWAYRGHWAERKTGKGRWTFKFEATKNRKAKGYGGFGKGTTGAWKINGIQYIRKTGKGRYQTKLIGTKQNLGFRVRKSTRRPKKRRIKKFYNR